MASGIDDGLTLGAEFPRPHADEWRALVEKALKGRGPDSLHSVTPDGITVEPLYTNEKHGLDGDRAGLPGLGSHTRGATAAAAVVEGWDIRAVVDHPDPAEANRAALAQLERGGTSLHLRLGGGGVLADTVDRLDSTLAGVHLDRAPIILDDGADFAPAAALLMALWDRRGVPGRAALGSFGADPIGSLARSGQLTESLDGALGRLADLARVSADRYPQVTTAVADGTTWADAAATPATELAATIATAVTYLRAMVGAGLDIDAACAELTLRVSVDADQFGSIARIRAARRLWARVAEVSGAANASIRVQATTSRRMLTRHDPWVNMLRATVACFAGAAGGADGITVAPFDAAIGFSDDFARRIARNTQIVLQEESNLHRVIDPAGGSWFVEQLTDELAELAWSRFQDLERAGGIAATLINGSLQDELATSGEARMVELAHRRAPLTGVSEFPNLAEDPVERSQWAELTGPDAASPVAVTISCTGDGRATAALAAAAAEHPTQAPSPAPAGDRTVVTPLGSRRDAESFENLRDRSDHHLAATGSRPRVFLATLGSVARHSARATFARNFFEVGGIEPDSVGDEGLADAEATAAAFTASGAWVACLCSDDPLYGELAAPVARALKAAGARVVWLAGRAGDHADAWAEAGIDGYLGIGTDILSTLTGALDALEVAR
ncbi:MAG: methylmalonyl-CoA mutase [Actinomycetia bacterium]|nr:methylmalonyl-CoA mutase [Actinomycetes bacterium]